MNLLFGWKLVSEKTYWKMRIERDSANKKLSEAVDIIERLIGYSHREGRSIITDVDTFLKSIRGEE